MRSILRAILRSAIAGAAVGLPILGIGGRVLMRVIAHWEGRVPAMSVGGTLTILFAGTMAGLTGGVVHGLLKWFVRSTPVMNVLFLGVCLAFTWLAETALLPRPRLMFVALTAIYVLVMEIILTRQPVEWRKTESA